MTVLNTIELMETAPWFDISVGVAFVLLVLCFVTGGVLAGSINRTRERIGGALIGIACILLIMLLVGAAIADSSVVKIPSGKIQYEVLINDDIAFSEVIEKYNIVDQRGEIFVVEEKE